MPTSAQSIQMRAYIDQRLLPLIRPQASQWHRVQAHQLKHRLHLLRHFCLQAEFDEDSLVTLEGLISLTGDLWRLLLDTADNREAKSDYTQVRTLSAEAEGLANLEELLSGEDTIRDIIINSIAFVLNWKSNTIWVDTASKAADSLAETGLVAIQEHVWRLLDARAIPQTDVSLTELTELGTSLEQLWQLMQTLPTQAQIGLLVELHVRLIRLEIGRLRDSLALSG